MHIIGVTIQNGQAGAGGGIFNSHGSSLFLTRSIVNNNSASGSGAGIFNEGTLNVTDSTITRNGEPQSGGGGITNNGGSGNLRGITVDNNSATGGGFTGGGGIENIGGILVITNSTISGNELTGGVSSRGGGINNDSVMLANGTIQAASLTLRNVTIANNSVARPDGNQQRRGGGIFNEDGNTVTLVNTIIDGNSGPTGGPDCFGTLTSRGFNLISNTTNCNIASTNNILNRSAELDDLAPNGGPTWTHALSFTSPAIDRGNNCPTIDQRRFPRPVDGPDPDLIAVCDIGAFERQ